MRIGSEVAQFKKKLPNCCSVFVDLSFGLGNGHHQSRAMHIKDSQECCPFVYDICITYISVENLNVLCPEPKKLVYVVRDPRYYWGNYPEVHGIAATHSASVPTDGPCSDLTAHEPSGPQLLKKE